MRTDLERIFSTRPIPLDSPAALEVKEWISAWARRTPHHAHRDLGQELELEAVAAKPIYSIRLTTLVEQRKVQQRQRPYRDDDLGPVRYPSAASFEPWTVDLPAPEGFEPDWTCITVEGSQRAERCTVCRGDGRHTCGSCAGKGSSTCSSCGGKPSTRCSSCGGRGRVTRTCADCGGTGTYHNHSTNSRQSCTHCGGSGKKTVACSSCGGRGSRTCSRCGGSGTIQCPTCGGRGSVSCSTCGSSGRILHFLELERTLSIDQDSTATAHTSLVRRFPALAAVAERDDGRVLVEQERSRASVPEFPGIDTISGSIDELLTATRRRLSSQDKHLRRQRLTVLCWEVYEVDYAYRGQSFRLVVHDPEGRVLDDNGPIYQQMMAHYEQGRTLAEGRRASAALRATSRAVQMDPEAYFSELHELRHSLLERVVGHYWFGLVPSLLATAVLYYALRLLWLPEPLVYLPALQQLFSSYPGLSVVHLHTTSAAFVLMVLVITSVSAFGRVKRNIGANLSSTLLRILVGLVAGLASGVWAMLMMLLLEVSGLTLLPGGAVYAVIELVSWLYSTFMA